MRLLPRAAFGCLALVAASGLPAEAAERDQITVVIPVLNGPRPLAQAVSLALKLQIGQSFRLNDAKRPGVKLDRGAAYYVPVPLPDGEHDEAERLARVNGAQMVLWGTASQLGKGAVAQTFLTIADSYLDFRENENETWSIRYEKRALQLEVPRTEVSFGVFALNEGQVEQYSRADALVLCKTRARSGCRAIDPDAVYRVLAREANGVLKVRVLREDWFLFGPPVTANQSQAAQFTAGVMAYFRGDWNYVLDYMQRVLEGPRGTELKIDARIYRGVAKYRLGLSGAEELEEAYKLNPFSSRTIRYYVMALLQEAIGARNDRDKRETLARAALSYLEGGRSFFNPSDPWFLTALSIGRDLAPELKKTGP